MRDIKRFVSIAIVLVVMLIPGTDLISQSSQCKQEAVNSLVVVAKTLQESGFSLNGTTPRVGYLGEGKAAGFQTTLIKGNIYAFVVAGGCVANVELSIYDENKNIVAKYDGGKPFAAVKVQPRWTGTFYGVIRLHGTTEDPAVVVQLMGWRSF
jgi:hypothetical protein